ncbi:MAG: Ig-like domain-containing protein [Deltaproteobacteria bacterium]|nr:Ig-like domain-containing protein [Deltaproteobacteria bacterium]
MALCLGGLVGCYNLPQPECGFACGPAGECPSSYSCNSSVNRCELSGTTPSCTPALVDAGINPDFSPPRVISQVPLPDTSGVSSDIIVMARFDEPVVGVSPSTFRLERDGIQVSGTVGYTPTIDNASFTPDSPLVSGTFYTATLTTGIEDLAGNSLEKDVQWSFTTGGDVTPPMVVMRSPAVDMTGVDVGASVVVDFDEHVFGVSSSSFTLSAGATPIAGSVSYSTAQRRATFAPTTQLTANTTYTARLTFEIEDTSFNTLSPVAWAFTTGADLQAPIVVTRDPAAGTTGNAVNTQLTATFDETVIGVSDTSFTLTPQGGAPVAATVSYTAGTRTARLIPDLQLAPNTQYAAALSAVIADGSGNMLAPFAWTFTTGADSFGPRVALTTPTNLATAVPTTSPIAVRFDEPVQNVSTSSFTVNGGAIPGTIALSAGNTIATFTPDAPLPASATISVNLTIAITDVAANALGAPFPSAFPFSFMTAP